MGNPVWVIGPRGPMPLRRMTAHWVVLAAAALTTLVAAAVAAALAVFAGQALPRAVTHDLSAAPGTALAATGPVGGAAQLTQVTGALKTAIGGALPGIPFGFWQGSWSDPLGLVPGAAPARPGRGEREGHAAARGRGAQRRAGTRGTRVRPLARGTRRRRLSPGGTTPRTPWTSTRIQAALPASAAALLHVSVGDVRHAAGPGDQRDRAVHGHRTVRRAPAGGRRRLVLAGQLAARQRVKR